MIRPMVSTTFSRRRIFRAVALSTACLAPTPILAADREEIRLWPGVAPGSETWTRTEVRFDDPMSGGESIRNVVDPTITVCRPTTTPNGTGIIVGPGGAFHVLSWRKEGLEIAEWLNSKGITVFLLKFRLADTGKTDAEYKATMNKVFRDARTDFEKAHQAMLVHARIGHADGLRAMQIVRERHAEWNLKPDRLGIMGFSSGAGIAVAVGMTQEVRSKADFVASIYGSSPLGTVPADAPPLFIACATDDRVLPFSGNMETAAAWGKSGRPVELHVFEKGGHGFAIRPKGLPVDSWKSLFERWLENRFPGSINK
jgi:acetyl esterase/lipase